MFTKVTIGLQKISIEIKFIKIFNMLQQVISVGTTYIFFPFLVKEPLLFLRGTIPTLLLVHGVVNAWARHFQSENSILRASWLNQPDNKQKTGILLELFANRKAPFSATAELEEYGFVFSGGHFVSWGKLRISPTKENF